MINTGPKKRVSLVGQLLDGKFCSEIDSCSKCKDRRCLNKVLWKTGKIMGENKTRGKWDQVSEHLKRKA